MERQRYPPELVENAKKRLKELMLSEKLTYHQAAKVASNEFPINILTLRYHAYQIAMKEGMDIGRIQHKKSTEHGRLLEMTKNKLLKKGYRVIEEQNEIRKWMRTHNVRGNPDLLAFRGQETLLAEVYVDDKKLIGQINRYSQVGKVILALPIKTKNIEIWGLSN